MSEQLAQTPEKPARSRLPAALILLLISLLVASDFLLRRMQRNFLEEKDRYGATPKFLEKLIRVGRIKSQALETFNNPDAAPDERLKAVRNLAAALKSAGKIEEWAELQRSVLTKLLEVADLGAECNELLNYYAGPPPQESAPAPKPVPAPAGGKTAAKTPASPAAETKSKPKPPLTAKERDNDNLRWVILRRHENIQAVLAEKPAEFCRALGDLAGKAARLGFVDTAFACLKDAFAKNDDARFRRGNLGVFRSLVVLAAKAGDKPLLARLSKFWSDHFTANAAEPPEYAFGTLAGWYWQCFEPKGVPGWAQIFADMLMELHTATYTTPAPGAIGALYKILIHQYEFEEAQALEAKFVPALEEKVFKGHPSMEDYQLLLFAYDFQCRPQADIDAVLELQKQSVDRLQKIEALMAQRKVVIKAVVENRLRQAEVQMKKLLDGCTDEERKLPEIAALHLIRGLLMAKSGDLSELASQPVPGPEVCRPDILGFQVEQVSLLAIKVYEQLRKAGNWELMSKAAEIIKALSPEETPRRTWLAGDLWLQDGAAGEPPAGLVTLDIPCLPAPGIKLDGIHDEPAYSAIKPLHGLHVFEGFSATTHDIPENIATTIWIFHDNTNLYLAMRCLEPEMDKSPVNETVRDATLWTNDCLEFFAAAERSLFKYQHWVVNQLGTVQDINNLHTEGPLEKRTFSALNFFNETHVEFNTGMQAAGKRETFGWTLEVTLPLADIPGLRPPFSGRIFPANVRRLRPHRGKNTQIIGWSRQTGYGHARELFNFFRLQ